MSDIKLKMNVNDMPEEMSAFIITQAKAALSRFTLDKDIAAFIKKAADTEFKTTWHVYVGRSFSSFVTHDCNRFMDFSMGPLAIQVFQCG